MGRLLFQLPLTNPPHAMNDQKTTETPLTDEEQWAVEKMLGVKNAVAADFSRSLETKLTAAQLREAELAKALRDAWQPIETAPKDQTRILCSYHGNRPFIARWRNDFSVFMDDWDSWRDATHWMPLPPSPNTQSSATPENPL